MVGTPLLSIIIGIGFFSLAIMLSYLVVLQGGAQSVIVNKDIRCSNNSN